MAEISGAGGLFLPIEAPSLRHQMLAFWAALILIGFASLFSFFSAQRLVSVMGEVEESQRVLVDVNRLVSALKDVETGARGYVITSDPRYLQPFHSGPQQFERSVARLREVLASHDPALVARVEELERLGRERIRLAGLVVSYPIATPPPETTLRFIDAGKAAMDRIRHEADTLVAEERETYAAARAAVDRQAFLTNGAIAAAVAISLGLLAWLFTISSRELRRRRRAEDELRTLNTELEERVHARTAELERSRELLDAVIENMPDTVFLKDADDDCRYILINRAAERLFGRSSADVVGHVDHELFPREQAEACQQEDLHVAASGRQRVVPERQILTSDGIRYVEARKVPITDQDGGRRLVLGIVRDVTEQKSLSDRVRQMQRMDAVGQLTGGIAHDFNNLLAVILGNVELLREHVGDSSEDVEMAEEAIGAASRGAELVRRMLAFARMQHLEPASVDLNERLPSITGLMKRALGENVEVRVRPAEGLWKAMVDPTQVDDALLNLGINARDAMPSGGTITIETANVVLDGDYAAHHADITPGEYVMLAVSDTGTGMAPDVIARAFEPFFTTKEPGKGTGLGLSQIYGWVKQSGGHIKIYSEVGHGTTMKLYLPRATSEADQEDAGASEEHSGAGSETIMVVEDNPNVRKTVLRQLHDLGYATIEAGDGAAALDLIRAGTEFDLLLTDVVMPGGMTGYELAQRAREVRKGLKVLFTSGYTEMAVTNGGGPSVGPLLSKPYRKQDLGRTIRAVLDAGE